MNNLRTNNRNPDQRAIAAASFAALLMLMFVVTPVSQATPMTVDVYGVPLFTLPVDQDKTDSDPVWMVLAPEQNLNIVLGEGQFNLAGPQDLTVRSRPGQFAQFGFLNMSLGLPGASAVTTGVIDYLLGNRSGSFTIHQVIDKAPVLRAESTLSIFFWGIDYVNGVGLILGLESMYPVSPVNTSAAVDEPSLLLLFLTGLLAFRFTSASSKEFGSKG